MQVRSNLIRRIEEENLKGPKTNESRARTAQTNSESLSQLRSRHEQSFHLNHQCWLAQSPRQEEDQLLQEAGSRSEPTQVFSRDDAAQTRNVLETSEAPLRLLVKDEEGGLEAAQAKQAQNSTT